MKQTKGTIVIASDHAGFEMKKELVNFLKNHDYEVIDHGPLSLDGNDDYPDFVKFVARDISRNSESLKGVVLGGSGTGEAVVCNRFPSVRAVSYYGGNTEIITLSRTHNNANVLSLGARFMSIEEACSIVSHWLTTPFSEEERHLRRIEKIDSLHDFLI
jgi:ribose 5-phosphate isomerase B